MNSLAGMVSTLSNIFGVQHGEFSTPGKVTIATTSAVALICGGLTLFYNLWLLRLVKREHSRLAGKERAGRHGEGVLVDAEKRTQRVSNDTNTI